MSRAWRYLTFAAAIVVAGVLSGVAGGATTVLVRVIEHVTYGYSEGPLLVGVLYTPVERRIAGPAIGCALAGLGWWLLRQRATVPGLGESIRRDRPFDHRPMAVDALLQVLAVGSGASLGREQAPRLFAASFTERVIRRSSLSVLQRRILLGSAAGAGLAAVYNVPAAGTLFALGIVLNSWRPLAVLVAVATSSIATVTVWPLSHGQPSFVWPDTGYTWKVLLFAIAAMPIGMLVGTGFTWIVDRAKRAALKTSWLLIPAVGLAGLVTGISSIRMPQLPGNGKSIILETLSGGDKLIPIAVVVLLKPLLTALFLRAGAVGGMLTPALSTGVATGAFVALAINELGGHASIPTFGLIGGAAVLGITQHAPVFAAVFTAELTHPPPAVWVMLLLAAVGAHGIHAVTARRGPEKAPAER
ncbi:chloride channel protein [Mycobacterium sp.]|uniref:chloride channel protein n=1 Tax=Mycobacterium sp. TaxID=1785 RepID=UPI002C1CD392|nr:chloride channel protein [Mycobacterium sp.]HME47610.1 chloride channel protein [Mycobacterium sp.]